MVNTRRAAIKPQPDEETKSPKQGKKLPTEPKPKNGKDVKAKDEKPVSKAKSVKKDAADLPSKVKSVKNVKQAKKDDSSDEEIALPTKRVRTSSPVLPQPTKKSKTTDSIIKQDDVSKRSTRGAKKQPDNSDKSDDSNLVQKRKSSPPAVSAKKKQLKKSDTQATSGATTPTPATPSNPTPKAKVDQPVKLVKQIKKGNAAVDSKFPHATTCHVYEQGGVIYSCTMNQTHMMQNNNKFYIIQVLETDSSPASYYMWNRWGRVGYDGQSSISNTTVLQQVIKQFHKKKNDKLKGGYLEIEVIHGEEETKEEVKKDVKLQDSKPIPESKLDRRVQDLMSLIFDLKNINRTLAEIGYDAKKMPLGKLSQNNIRQGLEVLKEIEAVLDGRQTGDVVSLSGRFYTLIPHDFGFQHMSKFTINTPAKLKEKVEMLDAISDMKIATTILAQSDDGNPVDEHYKKLNTGLTALEKDDPIYKMLSDYVKNTHATTHNSFGLTVLDIFRADKDNSGFKEDIDNHMLLWHGSRLTNWVGILSQGLRIAPPEAPVTGYMFGKGVYFADMVSKSANYCFTSRDNNIGLLMCCEVALGECNEKYQSDYNANLLPAGKSSTKGCGKTAPAADSYVDLEGSQVPLGKGQPTGVNGSLLYNEYIVYDIAQIKMKFLFKIRFDYK